MIALTWEFLFALAVIKSSSAGEEQTGKSENKCKEYVKYACDHPYDIDETTPPTIDAIANGEEVPLGALPHMAYISRYYRENEIRALGACGGTLISENFVMSAAHCVEEDVISVSVKLGSVTRSNDGTGQWFKVVETYVHPNYTRPAGAIVEIVKENDAPSYSNDIALLKLDPMVEFSPLIRPICLNTKLRDSLSDITVSGWGKDESGTPPKNLKNTEIHIDNEEVKLRCFQANELYPTYNSSIEICAGDLDGTKSAGPGDSGGPLQIPLKTGCPSTYEQIGVASRITDESESDTNTTNNYSYTNNINIFTKVEKYIPWIESIVWPN